MEGSYPREIQFPQERAVRNIKIEQMHRLLGTSAVVSDILTRLPVTQHEDAEATEALRQEEYESPRHDELMQLEFDEDVRKLYAAGVFGIMRMLEDYGHKDLATIVGKEYDLLRKEYVQHSDALEFIEATIREVSEPIADRVSAVTNALRQRKSLPQLY